MAAIFDSRPGYLGSPPVRPRPPADDLLRLASSLAAERRIAELRRELIDAVERNGLLRGQLDYLRVLILAKDREIAGLRRQLIERDAARECDRCEDPAECALCSPLIDDAEEVNDDDDPAPLSPVRPRR